jgi:deoxyribose-phosphate aldolase
MTIREVDELVAEAKIYKFFGVCVPPFWVKRAATEIGSAPLTLVSVVGYPLGYQRTETKLKEAQMAMNDGAGEIDVVMNLSAFKSKMNWVKFELAKMAEYVHEKERLLKVIIETDLWESDELIELSHLVADSGADFLKTSTGYYRQPVNIKTVKLIRNNLPDNVRIKASGGISDAAQAKLLIEAGADRLGTSHGKDLLTK